MIDETNPPFVPPEVPSKEPPKEAASTTTETVSKTVEVGRINPATIGGMSGRFWIALVVAVGAVTLCVLAFVVSGLSDTLIGLVIGAFLPTAANIIGTYMGQNTAKPKNHQ